MLENTFVHEGCENVYNESKYEKGADTVLYTWLTVKGSVIVLSMLDMNIELAEREFLEETLIDDEENDDVINDDDDQEFHTTWASWRDQIR